MMSRYLPILWRYLFVRYAKTLFVALLGFLFILLSTRLEEAARLLGLGAGLQTTLLFILYQIPYVLQIALPIATLIGALYLFQKLSSSNELTAARASGISLFELISPLILFSLLITIFSFQIIFDVSVRCHLAAKKLEYSLRELHPLAALQSTNLLDRHGMSLEMKGSLLSDNAASDMILAMNQDDSGKCVLVVAKKLHSTDQFLHGRQFSLITSKRSDGNAFDDLYIENAKENVTGLKDLSLVTNKNKMWKAGNDNLHLGLLLAKKKELQNKLAKKLLKEKPTHRVKKKLGQIWAELARRLSLAISVVTFTLLGASFGCTIGRLHSKRRFFWVVILTALFLVCYLAAKGIQDKASIPIALYLAPHLIICIACTRRLWLVQKGIEA
jgi:lipopolysaccharide export system permease protein